MRLYLSSFGLGNRPEELVRLLRGGKRAAVILNAKDGSSVEGRAESLKRELDSLTSLGLDPSELDLRDYFDQHGELGERLREVDLLWVRGGNTFVLRRAFRQSGLDEILPTLLANDAMVYGGFSAAVAVLTPSLEGVEIVDDPNLVPDRYDATCLRDGLGILPYRIAPHYRSDHPESERVERLVQYYIDRHVLFKAITDGEAIVIDGANHEIVR
jgi:dipeptidase E